MFETHRLAIPGLIEITPHRHGDHRGFFSEVWSAAAFARAGLPTGFVQDNHSFSAEGGVVRGLHYQDPPFAQIKLLRVTRGAIFDVAVDIRQGSPSFGEWAGVILSAEKWNQLLVPEGFAHGFMTLEPDCEVQYKVTAPYSPAFDRAIRWNDPAIGINWPLGGQMPICSERDQNAPLLADMTPGFTYSASA